MREKGTDNMPVKIKIVSAKKQKVPVKVAKATWREYLNY